MGSFSNFLILPNFLIGHEVKHSFLNSQGKRSMTGRNILLKVSQKSFKYFFSLVVVGTKLFWTRKMQFSPACRKLRSKVGVFCIKYSNKEMKNFVFNFFSLICFGQAGYILAGLLKKC